MRTPRRLLAATVALLVAASACSDSPTGTGTQVNDLASALDEMSLDALIPGGAGIAAPVASSALTPTGCAYNTTSQLFACAPVSSNGLTVTQDYTLLTSGNTPQSAFDAATTNAVRQHVTIVGTVAANGDTIDVNMNQAFTVSGLLSSTHVLDGSQVAILTSHSFGLTETITTTIASLVLPERGSTTPWPRSGSVTMQIDDAETGGSVTDSLVFVVTFNGTSTAIVSVTTGGVTQHCTVNLAGSGQLACA